MIIKERNYNYEQLNIIKNLSKLCNISTEFAKILYGRGYTTEEEILHFLNPGKNYFISPFTLTNMAEAVDRITLAKENGETVCVYGDYDADGICATTILYKALLEFGIDAVTVIPERENGYGLTEGVINEVLENYYPDLIITVDCGISSYNEIEYLKDLGVDVIVTDHHEIPETIPNCTVVNCKISGQDYAFDGLCGAGVSYKLAYALIGEKANKYLDLVAVATVADSMPLVSENRDLVFEGLKLIKNGGACLAIKSIMELTAMREVTATSLAYTIAPRVNAAGRMGDAYTCLKLFLSNNLKEIGDLSQKLLSYNVERQIEGDALYKSAKQKIENEGKIDSLICLYDDNWKSGLVGIASSKLVEEYFVPTILFTKSDGNYHGSARSIDGVNIYDAIKANSEYLIGFGGHSQAAGITISIDKFNDFKNALNKTLRDDFKVNTLEKEVIVDGVIDGALSSRFVKELTMLEPCGIQNSRPIFAIKINGVSTQVNKNVHVAFKYNGFDYVYFNGVSDLAVLNCDMPKTILFEPNVSFYNGKEYLKGFVKGVYNIENSESLYYLSLSRAFSNVKDNNEGALSLTFNEIVDKFKCVSRNGFGTLFIVNNPKNLEKLNIPFNIQINYYKLSVKNGKNVILVGGIDNTFDISNYDTIVYLDKPLSILKTDKVVYYNSELNAFDLDSLDTSRERLITIYKDIVNKINSGVNLESDLIKNQNTFSPIEYYFALEVFKELGFIINKDTLYINKTQKKDLLESTIYTKIQSLKK